MSKIDTASLSNDEKVLLVGERAEVASRRGNAAAASELFGEAVKQPMASRDAKGIMAQKYAAAVLAAGDPAGALKALVAAFDCASWTADALATRAAAYQRILAYALAMANFDAAIHLYQMAGRTVPAGVNAMRQQVADAVSRQGEKKDPQSVVENTDPASTDGQGDRPTDSSREAAAIIRVAPNYPEQALARGITGSVRLEFSISENGVVENARVVKSSDRILEQAALEALLKWRYVPRLRDGLPVRRDGVQTTIQFAMDGRVLR